jgi:hypothetical protein
VDALSQLVAANAEQRATAGLQDALRVSMSREAALHAQAGRRN